MTRIMYDSVTASDIPTSAKMVAGYVNGTYKWSTADWNRFPNAVKVTIATRANINDGVVLDVEQGAASVSEAPGWVQRRRAAGVIPTVYCSQSVWQSIRDAFRNTGVPEPLYWIAKYDNVATMINGSVAKQYINPPKSGGHFDLSIVADYWPGVDVGDLMADLNLSQQVQTTDGRKVNVGDCLGAGPWASLLAERNKANVERLISTTDRVETKVDGLATGGVNIEALAELVADRIADQIGTSIATTVADEIQRRLES